MWKNPGKHLICRKSDLNLGWNLVHFSQSKIPWLSLTLNKIPWLSRRIFFPDSPWFSLMLGTLLHVVCCVRGCPAFSPMNKPVVTYDPPPFRPLINKNMVHVWHITEVKSCLLNDRQWTTLQYMKRMFSIPSFSRLWPKVIIHFLTCRFDGRVVAKLQFVPISLLQNLSHRNLLGEDFTDCSFIFLYILCTMSIRQVGSHKHTYNL